MEKNILDTLDNFMNKKQVTKKTNKEYEECDLMTGECYTIREKDGIVERLNKKFVTNDGRQLLQD